MRVFLSILFIGASIMALVEPSRCAPVVPQVSGARPANATYRNLFITEDTLWSGEVHVDGGVTVAPQATLTVAPGSIVTCSSTAAGSPQQLATILIQGRLVVNGTAEQPVVFSGTEQDTGAASWQGIQFIGSEKNNLLTNTRIKGAAVGIDAVFSRLTLKSVWADRCITGIRVQDALFDAQGGAISGCGIALHLIDAESAVRGMQIQRNRRGLVSKRGSLLLQEVESADNEQDGVRTNGTRLSLERNRLFRNGNGLVVENGEGTVKGNRIIGQRGNGVVLTNARIRFRENVLNGNTGSGLVVKDGSAVAFANSFQANGRFDLQNDGPDEFRAPANWWGGSDPVAAKRLGGPGQVNVAPVLPQAPPEP